MSEEKLAEKVTLESINAINSVPQHILDKIKPGEMLLKARTLHAKFLPEPWLSRLAEDSENQRILWRHDDPEAPKFHGYVFGRVLESKVQNEFIESYYRIFGGGEDSKEMALQKLIKLKFEAGDPIGVSKGFIKYLDSNREIRRVISLEDSITYIPKCKSCKTIEVKLEMDEKELEIQIKKLQDELNVSNVKLEEKDSAIGDYETKLKKFEAKVSEFEAKVKAKDSEKESLEDKVLALSDSVKTLNKKLEYESKKPLIEEIVKFEQDEDLVDIYKSWGLEKLEARLTKVKEKYKEPQIQVKSLDDARKESMEREGAADVGNKAFKGADMEFMTMLKTIEDQDKIFGGT